MSKLTLRLTGGVLLAAGILVPSAVWIPLLRGSAPPLTNELIQGGLLFRIALFLLGSFIAALSLLPPRPPRPAAPVQPATSPATRWLIGLLLAAAFGIRLYQLGSGLWLDEILTYVNYARLSFGENVTTYSNENQHFLYSLMAHACFLLFGENAWALRLPAVLFGVGSIWALFLLGKYAASAREGLFAAALFAFSYHHVWFSQNARGYSGLLFWTILSSLFFLRALEEDRRGLWVAYAIAVTLGVYTHITMAFVIIGQLLTYAWILYAKRREDWPRRWDGFIFGFCLGGLLTFQLHALVFPQIRSGMARTVSVVDAWKRPLWALFEIARGLGENFAGTFVAIVALTVFGAGLYSYARKRPALLSLLFLPPLIGAAVVLNAGHHIWPRFFFFAFGFGALVVVRGAMVMEEWVAAAGWRPRLSLGSILCGLLVLVSAASVPFAFGPKQDYGGALSYLETEQRPGDTVVTAGLTTFTYRTLYQTGWKSVESPNELSAIRSQSRRTFVVYTLKPVLDSMFPEVASMLDREFKIVKQFRGTLQSGTVTVCMAERDPGQGL